MLQYQLQSGAKIKFNLGTIEQALGLYRALIAECKHAGVDIAPQDGETVLDMVMKNKEALLNIMGSERVMECIKECCKQVLYNGQKFSMDLFEEEKAREDFFPLMILVGVENVRPFFPNLHTAYSIILSLVLKP